MAGFAMSSLTFGTRLFIWKENGDWCIGYEYNRQLQIRQPIKRYMTLPQAMDMARMFLRHGGIPF